MKPEYPEKTTQLPHRGGQLYQLKKPEYPEKTTRLPHCGGQLYQLKKPEYPEKTTRTATSHTLTLSQELVSSTPHHEQELNSQL
jgi:hypothetical protein